MLDLPHAQVLRHALLMPRIRVDREPLRRGLRIRRQFQGVAARLNGLLLRNIRHGFFAILAWAGSHPHCPRGCKRTPKTRRKLWAEMPNSSFRLRLRPMRVQTRAENTIAWAPGSDMAGLRKPGIQGRQEPGRLLAYAPHRLPAKRQNRPCGKLKSAALNELVAQQVEQRPFNPNLAKNSVYLETITSPTIY